MRNCLVQELQSTAAAVAVAVVVVAAGNTSAVPAASVPSVAPPVARAASAE